MLFRKSFICLTTVTVGLISGYPAVSIANNIIIDHSLRTHIYPNRGTGHFRGQRVIDNIIEVEMVDYRRKAHRGGIRKREVRISTGKGGGFMNSRITRLRKTGQIGPQTKYYAYTTPYKFDISISREPAKRVHPASGVRLADFAPTTSNAEQKYWESSSWSLGSEYDWRKASLSSSINFEKRETISFSRKGLSTKAYAHKKISNNGRRYNKSNSASWDFRSRFYRPATSSTLKRQLWKGIWHRSCTSENHFYLPEKLNSVHTSSFKPKVDAVFNSTKPAEEYTLFNINSGITVKDNKFRYSGCKVRDTSKYDKTYRANQLVKIGLSWRHRYAHKRRD